MLANWIQIYHIWRADFLQRIRSRRFLVVLAGIAYLGYLVNVGTIELVYQQVAADSSTSYQGVPNAAWTGIKAGLTGSVFFCLAGFYIFKGVLQRDRSTGVGILVASAPVASRPYLLGKWFSNVSLAVVMALTLGGATVVNHVVHGVGSTTLLSLLAPILLLAIPTGALVGGIALWFETIDSLDGTLGNILYFMVFATLIGTIPVVLVVADTPALVTALRITDILGYLAVYDVSIDAIVNLVPNYSGGPPSFGIIQGQTERFEWTGNPWPTWVYGQRILTVVVGAGVAVLGGYWFDRFETNSEPTSSETATTGLVDRFLNRGEMDSEASSVPTPSVSDIQLTAVQDRSAGRFGAVLRSEFRLALQSVPWWWFLTGAGIIVVSLLPVVPPSVVRQGVFPIALLWPLFIWSKMGVRPAANRTKPLIFSSNQAVGQLFAEWLVGAVLVAVFAGGIVGRLVATGSVPILSGYAAAIVFIPSFAIAAGTVSENSRLFEASYLAIWYVGLLNRFPALDFAGVTDTALETGTPYVFLVAGSILLVLSLLYRHRQTR